MRRLSIALFLCCGLAAAAQENLIRNWSFEELDSNIFGQYLCPASAGKIHFAKHWNSAHGSVDYFNACSNENWPLWGVPHNFYGAQKPYDGDAYAALTTYTPVFSNAREYLWQPLTEPLRPDKIYQFSCWVSLSDSMNWASDGIGALFTVDDTRLWNIEQFLASAPQISSPTGLILSDKAIWRKIIGQFTALGGERYITIGAFEKDEDLSVIQVSDHYIFPYNWNSAVYYIDAISLYEVGHVGIDNNYNPDITIFPNPSDQEIRITHAGRHGELALREINGRIVSKGRTSIESTSLSTSNVADGIYILEFISDIGTKWQFRVVVQHP